MTTLSLEDRYRRQYEDGIRTFALLFTRFMDLNGWSHPVLVQLAKNAMEGTSWLHSSQISGLKHGKLLSPGPRTFKAIQVLNEALHRYVMEQKLIPGTSSSNHYKDPWVILEDGSPPSLGWFMEVFAGDRVPQDIDLGEGVYTETKAEEISISYGKLIRKLMVLQDYDPVLDQAKMVRENYPNKDSDRVERLLEVLRADNTWEPEELQNEIPAMVTLSKNLEGPDDEKALLDKLLQ